MKKFDTLATMSKFKYSICSLRFSEMPTSNILFTRKSEQTLCKKTKNDRKIKLCCISLKNSMLFVRLIPLAKNWTTNSNDCWNWEVFSLHFSLCYVCYTQRLYVAQRKIQLKSLKWSSCIDVISRRSSYKYQISNLTYTNWPERRWNDSMQYLQKSHPVTTCTHGAWWVEFLPQENKWIH